MANLQKRGNYTPRRVKEERAYRALLAGSATGVVGVVTLVLAVVGVIGYGLPIVMLLVAALCIFRFATITGLR